MLSRVTHTNPNIYFGKKEPEAKENKPIAEKAIDAVPVARKVNEHSKKAIASVAGIAVAGAMTPVIGKGLDMLTGADGKLVKFAQAVDTRTVKVDGLLQKLNLGQKIDKLLGLLEHRVFKKENVEVFKKGFTSAGGLEGAAQTARNVALHNNDPIKARVAERTIESLQQIKNLGPTARTLGKAGLFLKKHTTGTVGVMNGIFAVMTLNSVSNAPKGEKFKTFMEDLFGVWIGSVGGFKLSENFLRGCHQLVVESKTAGILPKMAKAVEKVPCKGFVVPFVGTMIISSLMQKLAHAVFGKPTKKQPIQIDSLESLNQWMNQIGINQQYKQ
ncbi:MAG: hypothetical protein AB7V50_07985 [Vampirovibrionia bacterium]